jgi:hypothetical protein
MGCSPIEVQNILMKMKSYGWIKTIDKDYKIGGSKGVENSPL